MLNLSYECTILEILKKLTVKLYHEVFNVPLTENRIFFEKFCCMIDFADSIATDTYYRPILEKFLKETSLNKYFTVKYSLVPSTSLTSFTHRMGLMMKEEQVKNIDDIITICRLKGIC